MQFDFHFFFFFFRFFSQLGKVYFDFQPSWFDTPSNNGGCFKVENFPVTAKDLEVIRNVKSNSRAVTVQAKGTKKETCKIRSSTVHICTKAVKFLQVTNQLDA